MGSNESSNFLSGVGFDRVCKTLTPNLMRLMAIEQCDSYNKPRLMPDVIWLFPIKFDRNYYLLFSSITCVQ